MDALQELSDQVTRVRLSSDDKDRLSALLVLRNMVSHQIDHLFDEEVKQMRQRLAQGAAAAADKEL